MKPHTLTLLGVLILAHAMAAAETADQGAKGQATAPAPALPAQAVTDPATTAAAAAAAVGYLKAIRDQGFGGAAAHLHPSALARFKALVLPRLKDEGTRGNRALLNASFGRTADYATAAAADPADFLVRFGRIISVREPEAAPRFGTATPLGVLREGERLLVLVRLSPAAAAGGPAPVERLEVVTLLADGTAWKADLDSRLQTVAADLGGRGPRPAQPPRFEPTPEGLAPAPLPGSEPLAPMPRPRPTQPRLEPTPETTPPPGEPQTTPPRPRP